jgi:hypothetical protein
VLVEYSYIIGLVPNTDRFAPFRRQSAPLIEVTSASKRQNIVALTTRAELDQQWAERQERPRYKKPPRRAGLKVSFVNVAPELIGEGGDEAEEPASECRRGRSKIKLQPEGTPSFASSESGGAQRREGLSAMQHTPTSSTSARPGTAYPPATPGPTLGDRVAIMTEGISDLPASEEQGYFPQMPTTLKQPGANAFANISKQHPALYERPRTAPSQALPQQQWVDSPTLPPEPVFQAQPAQGPRPRSHTSGHSPPKSRSPHLPGSSLDQSAERYDLPLATSVPPAGTSFFNADSTAQLRPGSSHSPTRRRIPSPLALSFRPSDGYRHPVPESDFRVANSSVSPQRNPLTTSSGTRPQTPAKPVFAPNYRVPSIEPPDKSAQVSSQSGPPSLAAFQSSEASGQRNLSQPYPIASKEFVHVRKPVGSRPSSSSSRPTSLQGQSQLDSRSSSQARQPSPTRSPLYQQNQPISALPPQLPPLTSLTSYPKQTEQESRNAALFVFVSRTKELAALIRSAGLPIDSAYLTTAQWLRAAVWWLLGARTDIKQMSIATTPPQAHIRAHLNVSKTWYIITELIAPRLASITASNAQGNAAYSADVAGLFTLTDQVVDAVKVTCLDMMANGIMPGQSVSTRAIGLSANDVVMAVSDGGFPRRWEELVRLLH